MPSWNMLCFLEAGIRLTQVLALHPTDSPWDEYEDALRYSALARLDAAVEKLECGSAYGEFVSRACRSVIDGCYSLWSHRLALDEREGYGYAVRQIHAHVHTVRERILEAARLHGGCRQPLESWVSLGLEIADGSGNLFCFDTPPPSTEDSGPDEPVWRWKNPSAVERLLDQLGLNRDRMFPGYFHLDDEDHDTLPGLPEHFWGWWSIEKGMAELRADTRPDNRRGIAVPVPENLDVLRLAKRIRRERGAGTSMAAIARDFTGGDSKKAQNLLRQLRGGRYKHLLEP